SLAARIAADAQDRMDDQMYGKVALVERRGERIDEKGHVVVDHLDDGVGAVPALFVEPWVIGADLGRAGRTLRTERPQGEGGAVEIIGCLADKIVGGDVGIEL